MHMLLSPNDEDMVLLNPLTLGNLPTLGDPLEHERKKRIKKEEEEEKKEEKKE